MKRAMSSMERWADVYRTRGPEAILGAWRASDVRDGRLVVEDAGGVRRELVAGEITILY